MQARRREEGGEKEGEDKGVERPGERLSHGGHAPSNLTLNAKTALGHPNPPQSLLLHVTPSACMASWSNDL